MSADEEHKHTCKYCNSDTKEDIVKMSLWEGEQLIVIENVPARVCEGCLEQFYDTNVLLRVDQLRGRAFPVEDAKRIMEVPVFSLPEDNSNDPEKKQDWQSRIDYDLFSDAL